MGPAAGITGRPRALLKPWVYFFVALITVLRVYLAARFPLTEDEAYYWVWSTHAAFGYLDHPPAVAWVIAAFSWLGHSALAVRTGFILCEGLAAIIAGGAAIALSGSSAAGSVAAVVLTAVPQLRWVIGEALPDGPYVLCWSAALWFAARAARQRDMVLLGVALGGTLLSRFFGWALFGGIFAYAVTNAQPLWRRNSWIAFVVGLAIYCPFVIWNATHGWANFIFTLHSRHPMQGFSAGGLANGSTLRFLLFAAIFCALAYAVTIKMQKLPLLAWTALPFPIALAGLSFFQPVESYWLLGPLVSLCVAVGIVFDRFAIGWRGFFSVAWLGGFMATACIAVIATVRPSAQLGGESALYSRLARDVRTMASARRAAVLSDSYETASELTYNGVQTMLAGDSPQTRQWSFWREGVSGSAGLFVSAADQPHIPCGAFARGPALQYAMPGSVKTYRTYWCSE